MAEPGRAHRILSGESLTIERIEPQDLVLVGALDGADAGPRLAATLACAAPAPNRWTETEDHVLASTGAGRWMVSAKAPAASSLAARLEAALGATAAVVDFSHGRVVFALEGQGARVVLAKGCTVDLRPAKLAAGAAIVAALTKLAVTILVDEGERFEVYVASSYADHVEEWLTASTREFA
ncbi:sarcosine oxidase subunit gamma [Phreatobacter stygius]|nr:sarcosine oxidase subunit gamma family protein [Phreatobacter stygius]